MLKNGRFLSNWWFKKGAFLKKVRFYEKKSVFIFFIKQFLHTFCYPTTFFESPITHKRLIFEESYISYGKRQKICTSIVI